MPQKNECHDLTAIGFEEVKKEADVAIIIALFEWKKGERVFGRLKTETRAVDAAGRVFKGPRLDLDLLEYEDRTQVYLHESETLINYIKSL